MNKKTLLYVAGAVAVVGIVVWYNRNQAKKRALAMENAKRISSEVEEEEESNAEGQQVGTMPCSSPNENLCKSTCERMGGTYNENGDRTCWKNGQPISLGGVGRLRAKKEMR